MVTTPYLGLTVWNLTTDPYDHAQLADNWARVDEHDHTPGKGKLITTAAIADESVTSSKLAGDLTLPANSITSANIADGTITLPDLASSVTDDWNYSYNDYRTVFWGGGLSPTAAAAGEYVLGPLASANTAVTTFASDPAIGASLFTIDQGDYAAGLRAVKFRIRAGVLINDVATVGNLTVNLNRVDALTTSASGQKPKIGTVVNVGTCGISTSGASHTLEFDIQGSDFVLAGFGGGTAGLYYFSVTVASNQSAGHIFQVYADLQVHAV